MTVDDDVLKRMMRALATPPLDDASTFSPRHSFESASSVDSPLAISHQDGVWYRVHDTNDISMDSIRRRPYDFADLHTDPDTSAVALAVTSDTPQEPLHRIAHHIPGYVSALQYRKSTTGERGNARPTALVRLSAKLANMWRTETPPQAGMPREPVCCKNTETQEKLTATDSACRAQSDVRPGTPLATQIARRRSTRTTPPRRKPVPSPARSKPSVPPLAMLAPAINADESTYYVDAMSADDSIVQDGAMVAKPAGSEPGRIAMCPPPRPPKSALRARHAIARARAPMPTHVSPVPSLSDGSDESDVEVVAYAIDESTAPPVEGLAISVPKSDDRSADASYASLF